MTPRRAAQPAGRAGRQIPAGRAGPGGGGAVAALPGRALAPPSGRPAVPPGPRRSAGAGALRCAGRAPAERERGLVVGAVESESAPPCRAREPRFRLSSSAQRSYRARCAGWRFPLLGGACGGGRQATPAMGGVCV